jgi:hypothetical protein
MRAIYKYPIPQGLSSIEIPYDEDGLTAVEILSKVVMQNRRAFFYALVDPNEQKTIEVETLLLATGQPAPAPEDHFVHLDTVQDGPFVWHVFIKIHYQNTEA